MLLRNFSLIIDFLKKKKKFIGYKSVTKQEVTFMYSAKKAFNTVNLSDLKL